jgi:hypothetical protein
LARSFLGFSGSDLSSLLTDKESLEAFWFRASVWLPSRELGTGCVVFSGIGEVIEDSGLLTRVSKPVFGYVNVVCLCLCETCNVFGGAILEVFISC